MEPIAWIFIIIVGIGAIIAGVAAIGLLIVGWWWIIPLIGVLAGGFIGFLFGLGLVVIIGFFVFAFKSTN